MRNKKKQKFSTIVTELKGTQEDLEVLHQVSIDNYSELTEQIESLQTNVTSLDDLVSFLLGEFEDLRKGLEWFLRIICVIVGVFLLACISGVL